MMYKLIFLLSGYFIFAGLITASFSFKQGPIYSEYLKSLKAHRKDTNNLDISGESECLTITKNMSTYNPIYTFRQCFVQRGYVLLN